MKIVNNILRITLTAITHNNQGMAVCSSIRFSYHSALTNMSRLNHNYVICSQFGSIVFFMEIFCHIYNVLITDNPIMDISTSKVQYAIFLIGKKRSDRTNKSIAYIWIQFTKWKIFHFIFRKRQ